jgi:hypothetical protein
MRFVQSPRILSVYYTSYKYTFLISIIHKRICPRQSGRQTRLPARYDDFVSSDTLVQQLLLLEDDEISIPLNDDTPFVSALHSIATTDAIIFSAESDNLTDPQSVAEAQRSKYWGEWLTAISDVHGPA